ncbi:hypothetical protein EST38_g4321 [Candolleomyces aberdarensis]|uniref:Lysine-specific metallo-endopeptidase domain-containing protein n=1 Tax=Candolleomyces aberdarensis TaxID=2316362 RepID=A0A4Q2DQN4_9AGAR|nr:hypothetical protein EST38_g4321 [Candolleomyces aberdarensis]
MLAPVLTAFVALASALSAAAAPSISLAVEGAEAITSADSFQVTTVITNTGDETVKLLNDPAGPLSKLPTDTFYITNSKGSSAVFGGIKAKYVPSVAAAQGGFTVLAPGASVRVQHDLGQAYNFTSTGVDNYEIEPRNNFYLVNDKGEVSTIRARVASAHSARVSGKLVSSKLIPTPTLSKRATYVGCSAARQTLLASAAAAAQSYAANSYSYISSTTAARPRYTTWFGAYTSTRRNTVLSHFNAINGNTFSSYTYDCTCTESGTYAYVYPDTYICFFLLVCLVCSHTYVILYRRFGRVYLCGAFWNAPLTGTDSKAGTLIHESSHFTANGGTDDHVYGQTGAKNLAISNPNNAVRNADNHEYFAENTPALS